MPNTTVRNLLIAAVVVAGLGVCLAGVVTWHDEDLVLLGCLAVMAVCSDLVDFGFPNSRISVTMALILAAGIFSGLQGVIVIAPVSAITCFVAHPKAIYKGVFNVGSLTLAGASFVIVLEAFSSTYNAGDWVAQIGPVVLGSIVAFGVNSGLVSLAIAFDKGLRPLEVWSECFRWMLPHYALFGLLGLIMAAAFDRWDITGLALLIAPLAMAWLTMKQYADRTPRLAKPASGQSRA